MLFSNPKFILYLKRNCLEVYLKNSQGVQARLDFPPTLEKDEEILDIEKFELLLASFLSKLNLSDRKVIVVISAETLFEKTISTSKGEKNQTQIQKFYDSVPFDPQKIAGVELQTKNAINLIATNKQLYESIVHVLQKLTAQIQAVVPITIFNISPASTLTKQEIGRIISNSELLKVGNFLKTTAKPQEKSHELSPKEKTKPKNYLLILGIIFIILGAVAIVIFIAKPKFFGKTSDSQKPQASPPQDAATLPRIEDLESTKSSDLEEVSKKNIKIQVLNGSGIAGQAAKIKKQLEDIAYNQIELGNTDTQNLETTKIVYKNTVSQNLIAQIKTELEKTLAEIETQQNSNLEDFDIIVTTGKSL